MLFIENPSELSSSVSDAAGGSRIFSVADGHTAPLFAKYFASPPDFVTPSGEGAKSLSILGDLWARLLEGGCSRRDCLLAFGGGAVTDLAGFAASAYKRGMRLILVPTTLIGMCDAALGGKTAINFGGLKNSIGAFYPPERLLICPPLLETLPPEEMMSGRGELLKYALLTGRDPEAFLSDESLPETIRTCIEYKEEVVRKDPFDHGPRQRLNLGHTAGHALEALRLSPLRGYPPVSHGVAVAAGLVIEAYLSFATGRLPQEYLMQLARFVREAFPAVNFGCGDYDALWSYALRDKKNTASEGVITLTLLEAPGRPVIGATAARPLWEESLDFYRDFFGV